MIRKYIISICKDWIALITGIASIPLTVVAFYADSPIIRNAWYISAWSCFIVATYRVWANEYRRAAKVEKQAPFVLIDNYDSFYGEDGMNGKEILIENIRIVNRGQSAALNIEVPSIQALGRNARLLKKLPTIGPNEAVECQILNLKYVLDRINAKIPKKKGTPWVVCLPLTLNYSDVNNHSLKTDIAIKYTFEGINFEVVDPNKKIDWTELEKIEQFETK